MSPTEHRGAWRPGSAATQGGGKKDGAAARTSRGPAMGIPRLAHREDQQQHKWSGGAPPDAGAAGGRGVTPGPG
ncbi:hypothetical protein GCM10010335_60000 [Streptomyces galbus]|nr:hypothetical protein GCM10010335_60000 [Streptomyces galbus]